MEQKELLAVLGDSPQAKKFAVYIVKSLREVDKKTGKNKNWWLHNLSVENLCDLYNRVASEGLYIDGEHITIQSTGIVFDYVAYKNKMLMVYPDSIIDVQLVYLGDDFDFQKDSGKVVYTHKLADPFGQKEQDIVGAYCVIKNKRGEFLTTLTREDIEKRRSISRGDFIWKKWFAEMAMKSVIKRACSFHYADIYQNIEEIDNENYDLEKPIEEKRRISDADFTKFLGQSNDYVEKYKDRFLFSEEQEKQLNIRIEDHA